MWIFYHWQIFESVSFSFPLTLEHFEQDSHQHGNISKDCQAQLKNIVLLNNLIFVSWQPCNPNKKEDRI